MTLTTLVSDLRAEEERLRALRGSVDRAIDFCGRMEKDGCTVSAWRRGRFGFALTVAHCDVETSLSEPKIPEIAGTVPPVETVSITTQPDPSVICVNQEQDVEAIRGKPADGPVDPEPNCRDGGQRGQANQPSAVEEPAPAVTPAAGEPWTDEEDALLKRVVRQGGSASHAVAALPHRTKAATQGRFYTIKRKLRETESKEPPAPPSEPAAVDSEAESQAPTSPPWTDSEEPGEPAERSAGSGTKKAAPAPAPKAAPVDRVNRPKPPDLGASLNQPQRLPPLRGSWTRARERDMVDTVTKGAKLKVWAADRKVDLEDARTRFRELCGGTPTYDRQLAVIGALEVACALEAA